MMTPHDWKVQVAHQEAIARCMSEIRHTEGWQMLVRQLDDRMAEQTELMLQGGVDKFEYRKGLIEGLRVARALPDLLIAQAEAAHA